MEKKKTNKRQHSYSRLSTFAECPLKYKLRYIDKVPAPRSRPLEVGGLIHDAAAAYAQECINQSKTHLYDEADAILGKVFEGSVIHPAWEKDVRAAYRQFVQQHEIPLEDIYGVEEKFSLNRNLKPCPWMAKDVYFRGVIDLLQVRGDYAKITDYKSGYMISSADEFQLRVYAWGIKKLLPQIKQVEISLDFIRHDWQTHSIIDAEKDLGDTEKEILRRCGQIDREEKFEPKMNEYCEYCTYHTQCPLLENIPDMKNPENEQQARKIAEAYVATSLKRKDLQKKLKAYVDTAGPIQAAGKQFGVSVSERYTNVNVPQLILDMTEHGVDILPYLKLDMRSAKKLFEDEELEKILNLNAEKKKSTRFRETKAPKDE